MNTEQIAAYQNWADAITRKNDALEWANMASDAYDVAHEMYSDAAYAERKAYDTLKALTV